MVKNLFPFLDWLKPYHLRALKFDALAGFTVALVLIPQSMAYAQLAGLPIYYGLYASLLPPLIAGLFGSSRQLATGPVAVVEDVTTTGGSALKAVEAVREAGAEVNLVVTLVDRQEGGTENLRKSGVELEAIFTREEILADNPV